MEDTVMDEELKIIEFNHEFKNCCFVAWQCTRMHFTGFLLGLGSLINIDQIEST